jgi:hypothetical protein
MIKVVCVFFTIRMCSSGHIVTIGDAVASFLERRVPGTKDSYLQTQRQILEFNNQVQPQAWKPMKKRVASTISGKRLETIVNL